jgi:hypothetical protein
VEKPALQALPQSLFPVFSEAPRQVHRDGHIEVDRAYYSVPPEYVSRSVWARWDTALVHVYDQHMKSIAVHPRCPDGQFSTQDQHIHSHKRCLVERGLDYLLRRCAQLGTHTGLWAQAMYENRGVQGLRVLQGFLHLAETHSPRQLNEACRAAVDQGAWRLREVKGLMDSTCSQDHLPFLEEHPLIRPLSAYDELVPDCFATTTPTPTPSS